MTRPPAMTVRDCIAEGATLLDRAGIESPRREARLLLAHAMARPVAHLVGWPETPVADPAAYRTVLARRAAREPLSRIVGEREFWSLPFRLVPATLDPRPDSETVVEAALDAVADRDAPLRVLDLGTGSGCLLLAVLSELPQAWGLGIDIAAAAAAAARDNAEALGLAPRAAFLVADWTSALGGLFDMILANPPYIRTAAIRRLAPEVADFDPLLALDGGRDGLAAYRRLVPALAFMLAPGGTALLELGRGQAPAVAGLAAEAGLEVSGARLDLAGRTRVLMCRAPARMEMQKKVGRTPFQR